jgi:hypothetical protein
LCAEFRPDRTSAVQDCQSKWFGELGEIGALHLATRCRDEGDANGQETQHHHQMRQQTSLILARTGEKGNDRIDLSDLARHRTEEMLVERGRETELQEVVAP